MRHFKKMEVTHTTARRNESYIDKHGNVNWMETAKINNATNGSEQVISGEKSAGEVLMEQAKTEHTNAWSAVQSAFFDTSLDKHKRFSEFEDTDPGEETLFVL